MAWPALLPSVGSVSSQRVEASFTVFKRQLGGGTADHDGQVVRWASAGAESADQRLQIGQHLVRFQQRRGALVQKGLVRAAATLGDELQVELVGVVICPGPP